MARSRYRDALSAYNRSIDLGADYDYAKGRMGRAQALQRLGRARDALRAYDRVTDTKPDYFEAWFNKSGVLRTLARHESALIATARAESIRPDHVDVHLAQGESLVALAKRDDDAAQWQQAYEAYVRATNLAENHASAWSMKGVSLLMLGRFAEGSEALEGAILLRPEYVQDWWHKAQALLKMAEGQPMESSVEVRAGLWWLCRA